MKKSQHESEILAAYALGDLDPAARTEFEQRLKDDPCLQKEIEEYRRTLGALKNWMRDPLPISEEPAVPPAVVSIQPFGKGRQRTGSPAVGRSIVQIAAAAVLFLGGYLFGQKTASPPAFSPLISEQPAPPIPQSAPAALDTPVPAPQPMEEQGSRYALDSPRLRSFEQDGKLIVETKLSRSDSTAVWIVNGDFGLEN
jgi:hypothetical protein